MGCSWTQLVRAKRGYVFRIKTLEAEKSIISQIHGKGFELIMTNLVAYIYLKKTLENGSRVC